MRVIYYAEPEDPNVVPKQIADSESLEARWVTLEEFQNLDNIRGDELVKYGSYVETGGPIHPLGMFSESQASEGENVEKTMCLRDGKFMQF